jgi:hypothetical protein
MSPADYTKNYENPWNADEVNGKCHDDEKIGYLQIGDQKWATCMPRRDFGNSEQCPKPPTFDSSLLDAFAVDFDEYHRGCVVECSESLHHECPTEAVCQNAPTELQTNYIKKICYYPQHVTPPTPPIKPVATDNYEDPFIADSVNGACHRDEMVMKHIIGGKTYGQCMPLLFGDLSDCPKPPGMEKLWLSAYDTQVKEYDYACTVECSNSYEHACPKGGVCMPAPTGDFAHGGIANDRVKNVCVYEQPAPAVRQDLKLLRQSINNFQANFHYEDPFWASHTAYCTGTREAPQQYDGLDDFYACMPETFGRENKCYQDYPAGTTATPMPIFVGEDGKPRCALVCSGAATGICGPRAECMILPGLAQAQVGVCLYKKK